MILSDFDLKAYLRSGRLRVTPFDEEIIRENGLDLRIGDEIARFINSSVVVDIENTRRSEIEEAYVVERGDVFIIEPYEHVLISTLEYIEMPPDLMGFVELRSTYARLGMLMPPTIVDASFRGQLTLEVRNGPFRIKLKRGARFAHIIFAKLLNPVEKPYSGKYQGQKGVTLPKLDGWNS
ncbi:MAG: dCTP deaminase [Thermoprotei archaeon]|nr:MAG: dCTP deaminase [Thermoprotei archaeon]RLF25448.1 MAG: dCTP deaminase [Thermoprotei archaeon]